MFQVLSLLAVATVANAQYNLIATYAGTVTSGCNGYLGSALSSQLPLIGDVHYTADDTGYYPSWDCSVVLKHTTSPDQISLFAGQWENSGNTGDGGRATSATLSAPSAVASDPSNSNIYICGNGYIRKVNIATTVISLFAGDYTSVQGGTGDGGPALSAKLDHCGGMHVNSTGYVFFSNLYNGIRVISPGGIITRFSGQSSQGNVNGDRHTALWHNPGSLWADTANMYVADTYNCQIRKIDMVTGEVSAAVGTSWCASDGDGGQATSAYIQSALSVCGKDTSGNLYFMDQSNSAVRKVDTSGIVTLFAGGIYGGYNGDWIQALDASFKNYQGGCTMHNGQLYFSETDQSTWDNNNRIRTVYVNVQYPTYNPTVAPTHAPSVVPTTATPTYAPTYSACCGCRQDQDFTTVSNATTVTSTYNPNCGATTIVTTETVTYVHNVITYEN